MKKSFIYAVTAVASLLFAACNPDNGGVLGDGGNETAGGNVAGESGTGGNDDAGGVYYVLNSGDWKSNNSSLTKYDAATGEVVQNCFEQQNGRLIGNTANDILVYGSKMYIAVAGESTVEVTDLDAKTIEQLSCDAQPRYLAAAGGKVYVSYYDGHVARIDTATLDIEEKVKVGRNPEQLAVVGNKLYVANSGGLDYNTELGYDKTVSVIDLVSFEEVKKIDVVLNPAVVVPVENGVYVASYGNYADVLSTLQYINAANDAASVVEVCSNMTEICYNDGVLYGFFSQYDENYNATTTYASYDVASKEVDSPWIKENELPIPYKVCSAGGYLCVTSSDYFNDGDVYVYDTDGMLVKKIAVGLNPIKMVKAK